MAAFARSALFVEGDCPGERRSAWPANGLSVTGRVSAFAVFKPGCGDYTGGDERGAESVPELLAKFAVARKGNPAHGQCYERGEQKRQGRANVNFREQPACPGEK